jgi:hypothetical protein
LAPSSPVMLSLPEEPTAFSIDVKVVVLAKPSAVPAPRSIVAGPAWFT